jgi:ATP-dependent Lon protease
MPRKSSKAAKSATLIPVMPLRDTVIFPNTMFPVLVGREQSVQAIRLASESDKRILLLTQKNPEQEDPTLADLNTVGTLAQVVQILNLPNGLMKVLVNGLATATMVSGVTHKGMFMAEMAIEETPTVKSERVLSSLVRKTR